MKPRNQLLQFSLLIVLLSGCNSGGVNQINNPSLNQNKQSQTKAESTLIVDPVIYDESYLKSVIWKPLLAADESDPGNGKFVPGGSDLLSSFVLDPISSALVMYPKVGFLTSNAIFQNDTGIPLYGNNTELHGLCLYKYDYDFRANDTKVGPVIIIPNDDLQLDIKPISAGDTRLINSTDNPLTLTSGEITYSQAVTKSTATTLGWKVGTTVASKTTANFAFVMEEVDVSVSAEVSVATTDTVSTTETLTYKGSAQDIQVPPHTTAIVYADLQLGTATGTYTTYTPLNPDGIINWSVKRLCLDDPGRSYDAIYPIDLKQAYKLAPVSFRNTIDLTESNNNIYLSGSGKYSVQHAAKFQVYVEFVPFDGKQNAQPSLQGVKQNKIITYTIPAVITPKK